MPLSGTQNHFSTGNKQPDLAKYLSKLEAESPFYPMASPKPSKSTANERTKLLDMDDSASIMTTSSSSSTAKLIQSKFTSKTKASKPEHTLSPGEKQAARRAGRVDPIVLATWAALRYV